MKQKLLLLIFALLAGTAAHAQKISYGVTARAGVFKTLVSEQREAAATYDIGLQASLGAWLKLPLANKSSLQFNILNTAERQGAGEVQVIDYNRHPIADAEVRDENLAVALQLIYLYALNERWSAGTGVGFKYEYYSKNKIEKDFEDYLIHPSYDNEYRQDLTLHLPVEIQYTFNERFALAAQAQVQLSNRLDTTNSDYRERDLGFSAGINYKLK
ncbi:transporter [Pontibacter sp. Tf4]|uniref:transporter n=1 Tax=Pontibacter sp. Tf4 TaxID=2761620 RepID=UPI001629F5DA|nr:transporter [Pontibacter sp. Tf4]MBB6611470.1 transporter [Pontibacter sp. Tf4]